MTYCKMRRIARFMDDLDAQVDAVMMPYLFERGCGAIAPMRASAGAQRTLLAGRRAEVDCAGRAGGCALAVHHRKKGPGDPTAICASMKSGFPGRRAQPARAILLCPGAIGSREVAGGSRNCAHSCPVPKGVAEDNLCACRLLARCNEAQGKEDQALDACCMRCACAAPRRAVLRSGRLVHAARRRSHRHLLVPDRAWL